MMVIVPVGELLIDAALGGPHWHDHLICAGKPCPLTDGDTSLFILNTCLVLITLHHVTHIYKITNSSNKINMRIRLEFSIPLRSQKRLQKVANIYIIIIIFIVIIILFGDIPLSFQ